MSKVLKAGRIITDEEKYKLQATRIVQDSQEDISEDTHAEIDTVEKARLKAEAILEKARKTAEEHLTSINIQAEEIISKANEEAVRIKNEAYEESYRKGSEEGYSVGLSEAAAIKLEAQEMLNIRNKEYDNLMQDAESDMVELIEKVIRKLLGDSATIRPEIILNLIRQGLSDATVGGNVVIHCSHEDYAEVLRNKDQIASLIDGSPELTIMKDLSLRKSDCIIETPFGNIDCSLDRQFAGLSENLHYIHGGI